MVDHAGLRTERLAQGAERLCFADIAHALDAVERLDTTCEVGQRRRRGLILEKDHHSHAVTPLPDGAPEVQREEPESAERGQRQGDEEDRADADAARAAKVHEGLADDEAQHCLAVVFHAHACGMLTVGRSGYGDPPSPGHPSSFVKTPASSRSVRRLSWVASRAWWVAKRTVVPRLQM